MRHIKMLLFFLAPLGLILLSGCGQSSTPTTSGGNPSPTPTQSQGSTLGAPVDMTGSQQVTIKLIDTSSNPSGFWFDNPSIKIKVGTTVTWINTSSAPHTVTSGAPGAPDGKFDSGISNLLQPGNKGASSTFTFTFKTAGSFPYFCQVHPSMIGLVQVVS